MVKYVDLTEEEKKEYIMNLSLKSDVLFNIVFRDDIELAKEFVEVIEGEKLSGDISFTSQKHESNNLSKTSVFDLMLSNDNDCYITEMQQQSSGFPPQRADLILSTIYSKLVKKGMEFNDYPKVVLHVLCAYPSFDKSKYKHIVKQSVNNLESFDYETRLKVVYHDITSNSLPNNLYGDLCRFINDNTLSNHSIIKKLDEKIKKIKRQENTFMELHENLGTLYWAEQGARYEGKLEGLEQGLEQGKLEAVRSFILANNKRNISKDDTLKSCIEIFDLTEVQILELVEEIY